MYFVTTCTKLEFTKQGFWDFGSTRTVGFYSDLERAREVVINNECDLCETIYEYILIEGLGEDLYPEVEFQELYKVKNPLTPEGFYNLNLTYEKIAIPVNFLQTGLAVG